MTPCDPTAVAVDWLDAYRDASLDQIIAMYSPDGVIECACGGRKIIQGAEGISAYWRHRVFQIPALELEDLQMDGGAVVVSYRTKSRTVLPKPSKGGRPATGRDPVRAIRLSDDFVAKVDAWAAKQDGQPGRTEAIRRPVELGLSKSTSSKNPRVLSTAKEGAKRAVELTNDVIGDQMPNTSDEETTTRGRRLIKGPSEFRNVRRDRPQ